MLRVALSHSEMCNCFCNLMLKTAQVYCCFCSLITVEIAVVSTILSIKNHTFAQQKQLLFRQFKTTEIAIVYAFQNGRNAVVFVLLHNKNKYCSALLCSRNSCVSALLNSKNNYTNVLAVFTLLGKKINRFLQFYSRKNSKPIHVIVYVVWSTKLQEPATVSAVW